MGDLVEMCAQLRLQNSGVTKHKVITSATQEFIGCKYIPGRVIVVADSLDEAYVVIDRLPSALCDRFWAVSLARMEQENFPDDPHRVGWVDKNLVTPVVMQKLLKADAVIIKGDDNEWCDMLDTTGYKWGKQPHDVSTGILSADILNGRIESPF